MAKAFAWLAAWFGTVSIADLQPIVSVISGALVGLLAAANLYKVVRDMWRKKDGP